MHVVMLGPFGLHPKGTMRARALPAARALAARGHRVTLVMPPWHTPAEAGRVWADAGGGARPSAEAAEVGRMGPGAAGGVPTTADMAGGARETADPTAGVRLEYVALDGLAVPLAGHAVVAARMARRALALAPDVVHAFKPKAYSGLAAMLLRARQRLGARSGRGAPFALLMDTDDWEGPGGWNELEPYGPLQRRVFAWQERWGITHADAVTVASRALETLVWSLGVPPERVTYLPNAIEVGADAGCGAIDADVRTTGPWPGPASAPAAAAGHAARPPTLLLYTRFFEFDLARPLAVLDRVRQDQPGARLLVVGRGLFGEESAFLELARRRGLADAVDYRGWVEPEDLPAVMAAADVALYPFDDTLVNRTKSAVKLLELMAAGLPVVAEAVGQNREVIEDGRSGRLVEPGDVAGFAAAVSALLADPERRRALGAAARERVSTAFAWPRLVEVLEGLYFAVRNTIRRTAR